MQPPRAATVSAQEDARADYLEWEKTQQRAEFERIATRRRKLKVQLDCGHWIDGSELYRYQVWKYRGEPISQRTDCEPCARKDSAQ